MMLSMNSTFMCIVAICCISNIFSFHTTVLKSNRLIKFNGMKIFNTVTETTEKETTNVLLNDDKNDLEMNPRHFLSTILSSRSSIDTKKQFINKLQNLRMVGMKEKDSYKPDIFNYSDFLDELIVMIDSTEGNRWALRRLPIPLPSLRMKMGSARRLLNTLIETDDKNLDKENNDQNKNIKLAQRRRALGILINQLGQSDGGVRGLELEALTRLSRNTMEEMLLRTPKVRSVHLSDMWICFYIRIVWVCCVYMCMDICIYSFTANLPRV